MSIEMSAATGDNKQADLSNLQYSSLIQNPTFAYYETHEKLHGFLSKQYPTIGNPAPLGLCAFALTTFVMSMYNAGAIIGK